MSSTNTINNMPSPGSMKYLYSNFGNATPASASLSPVTIMPNQTVTGITVGKNLLLSVSLGYYASTILGLIIKLYMDGVVINTFATANNGIHELIPFNFVVTATATTHVFTATVEISILAGTVGVDANDFYSFTALQVQ